jgi:nitrite reductase/ring-hydroxylating ferredoxin subunit
MKLKTLLALAAAGPLLAHDLYIMPETFRPKAGQTITVALHNGDAFPESEGPPSLERLHDTRLLSGASPLVLEHFRDEHKALVSTTLIPAGGSGSLIFTASLSANSRSYDAKKFATYVEEEGLGMIAAYRKQHGEESGPIKELYSKFAKALIFTGAPSAFSTHPVGMKIEIVPAVDPGTLKAGASLPVKVLFDGKPAAGLSVECTHSTGAAAKGEVVGHTDKAGRVSVPLVNGRFRITTGMSRRNADQNAANWETFFATLTFAIGE